jgi:DNA-directed RNA polymerase specialized sigma24 family protein
VFEAAAIGWSRVPRDDEGRRRWLFRVLQKKSIDLWRKESQALLRLEPIGGDYEASSADDDPCVLVINSISDEQLWKELKVMPPMQYHVAYLSWRCGWSAAEIAENLGIAAATVRVHKHNAVMQLRRMTLQNLDATELQDKTNPGDAQESEPRRHRGTVR